MSFIEEYKSHFGESDLKQEVSEIVRSYRHSWDILSELIQNSVDAINRKHKILNDPEYYMYNRFRNEHGHLGPDPDYRGKIRILWNKDTKTIAITDNGIGMESEKIVKYMLPKGSGKTIGKDYGFKGYGFTFAVFASNEVIINSKFLTNSDMYEICLKGCFKWLSNNEQFPQGPIPEPRVSSNSFEFDSGTSVKIQLSTNYSNHFPAIASLDDMLNTVITEKDIPKLEYLLRSRTAIGNTRYLFSQEPIIPVDVELEVIIGAESYKIPVKYNYYHPKEHDEVRSQTYSFDQYVRNLTNTAFQRDFRALYHTIKDQEVGSQKKVKFDVALCAISQTRLNNIEKQLGIPDDSDYNITYGVHLSIDGMPTGIRIDNWDSGGGHLKRYFVIVDADLTMSEQLDSGRKGISQYYANLITKHIMELIASLKVTLGDNVSDPFGRYALMHLDTGRVVGSDISSDNFFTVLNMIDSEKESYTQEEKELLNKVMKYTSLQRLPKTEHEVIIMFYHLLEKGIIKGYKTTYLSGITTYDAALSYKLKLDPRNNSEHDFLGISPAIMHEERMKGREFYDLSNYRRDRSSELCVEFKQTLGSFLREIQIQGKTEKNPGIIDIIICWDDLISPTIKTDSYTLGMVYDAQRRFHGTTHRLGVIGPENNTEIFCIILKKVLQDLE